MYWACSEDICGVKAKVKRLNGSLEMHEKASTSQSTPDHPHPNSKKEVCCSSAASNFIVIPATAGNVQRKQ